MLFLLEGKACSVPGVAGGARCFPAIPAGRQFLFRIFGRGALRQCEKILADKKVFTLTARQSSKERKVSFAAMESKNEAATEVRIEAQTKSLETAARAALAGDKLALNHLVTALQSDIYGLSLRMLSHREDAEDATQEILVRIVTRLSQYDFRSKLRTWAYRVAVNYLLDVKKSAAERMRLSFDQMGEELSGEFAAGGPPEAEQSLLVEEVKIGCSLGMLQCLGREERLAYVLGEIMELQGPEAAAILEISPELFRKRLQLARTAMLGFLKQYCGLASESASCHCNRMVPVAVASGRVQPESLHFAIHPSSFADSKRLVHQVEEARWAMQLHRTSTPRSASVDFARRLLAILELPHEASGTMQ